MNEGLLSEAEFAQLKSINGKERPWLATNGVRGINYERVRALLDLGYRPTQIAAFLAAGRAAGAFLAAGGIDPHSRAKPDAPSAGPAHNRERMENSRR